MFLFITLAAAIAAGCLIFYAVKLTFEWLKNKIKEKLRKKNAKKIAVADMEEMIKKCDNTVSLRDLEDLSNQGYSHIIATVDEDNHLVDEVEAIKDQNEELDAQVYDFINRTDQGMVVIES